MDGQFYDILEVQAAAISCLK